MRQLCSTVPRRTLRSGKNTSSDPPLIRRGILYIDDCEALFCDKLRAKCMEDFKKELAEKCRRYRLSALGDSQSISKKWNSVNFTTLFAIII